MPEAELTIQLDPLWTTVFAAVILGWVMFAAAFFVRKPAGRAPERKRDRSSLVGIAVQSTAYMVIWMLHRPAITPIGGLTGPAGWALALLACALVIYADAMVWGAIRELGKQWSLAARLVEDHALITSGPYRIVRHPIYSSMFGMLTATGLAVSQPLAIPIAIVLFAAGTAIRVRSEERLLREAFPAEYEAYARRVRAIIPGLI
jgi:protein-S-isoprenylcysteine O-methyltransferase Ste14